MPISVVGFKPSGADFTASSLDVVTLRTGPTEICTQAQPVATLVIRVRDQDGSDTYFKVKKTTRLEKVINTHAARKGVDSSSLLFFLAGVLVRLDDTPEKLGLRHHDKIDCVLARAWTRPLPDGLRDSVSVQPASASPSSAAASASARTAAAGVAAADRQQLRAREENNEGSSRTTAASAEQADDEESKQLAERELRRRVAFEGITGTSPSLQTTLEELRKRTIELESAQAKLERRTLLLTMTSLVLVAGVLPLTLLVAAGFRL